MFKMQEVVIDWKVPPGKPDWLMGNGADRSERSVVWATTVLAVAALVALAAATDVPWSWWQWALITLVVVDVAGGVPANSLNTAKRFYHSANEPEASVAARALKNPIWFSALHIHPFVLLLMPGATVVWASTWYAISLLGTIAVARAPLYLERAMAAGVVTVALISTSALTAPDGLWWVGPILVFKLVVAHAVREEPYRPARVSTKDPSR